MPKRKTLQSKMPEAVASGNCTITSPSGFPWQVTLRQPSFKKLLEQISEAEIVFTAQEYQPDIKRGFGKAKKPVEIVPGRQCPTCNNPLVYFEAKGQKHIKCSTQKWDFTTKQTTGCPYVEWADRQVPLSPSGGTAGLPATPAPGFNPATQAQITLIQSKFPQFYREGLSFDQAHQIISSNQTK